MVQGAVGFQKAGTVESYELSEKNCLSPLAMMNEQWEH